jgi:hypothetical protein
MTRRGDPVRIYLGQRAGMLRRLVEALGLTEDRAEAAIRAWEAEASRRGLRPLDNEYWVQGEGWMTERRTSEPR